jgi:O-antigen/teichoic acid export membrane protein
MDLDVSGSGQKTMTSVTSSAITGSKWTSVSQVILLATALLQTTILARLLSPADFGIVAIAGVFIGILTIYSELGLSSAIIQKSETSNDILSSLYLLNLGAALLCSLITLAAAPVLTQWYGQIELQNVLASLAPAAFR